MNIITAYALCAPLVKGIVSGAIIALPIGPIGIICMRRLLTQGPLIGMLSGIGGATADVLYAGVAIVGLSAVAHFLEHYTLAFRIASALVLLALGIKIILTKPAAVDAPKTHSKLEAYLSTFFLTLTNPLLIVLFASAFAALEFEYQSALWYETAQLLGGVFIGSAAWWVILGIIFYSFNWHKNQRLLLIINVVSGVLIISASIVTLAALYFGR